MLAALQVHGGELAQLGRQSRLGGGGGVLGAGEQQPQLGLAPARPRPGLGCPDHLGTNYRLQFTIRGHHLIKLIEAASQGHIHHYYVDTVIDSENVDKQMGRSSQGMSLNNFYGVEIATNFREDFTITERNTTNAISWSSKTLQRHYD